MATLAFVMDPVEGLHIKTDTTFALMLAAFERGHRVIHLGPSGVTLEHDRVFLAGRELQLFNKQGAHFREVDRVRVEAGECAAVFIRSDPPFDQDYLTTSWILSFAEEQGVRMINSPRGLRTANEHLYSMFFPELCPDTLVTSSHEAIVEFVARHEGRAIAKPIDGHAGFGVVKLVSGDSNQHALVDMLTLEGRQPIMVQEFLPEVADGDKRLIVVDGELRGAVKRLPREDDHRGNVHVGGRAEAAEITPEDQAIVSAMGPRLRADGLFFVGMDVIGGRLIEVNVTSPTLLQELRRLGGPDLAAEIIERVAG